MWNRKVFIRVIEVLLCIACVVALRVTDDESRRVFTYLRYRSREWTLLNNVTWGAIGAALASVTCGGYIIITAGLLVAAASGELNGRKTELFLLGLGIILFGIVGALSLASIESVPTDLIDNAAVLGALCLVTALVFIADLLMTTNETKAHRNGTNIDPKLAKHPATTLTVEKETKSSPKTSRINQHENGTFIQEEKAARNNDLDDRTEESPRDRDNREVRVEERPRNRQIENVERQMREYSQNLDNDRSNDRYNGDIQRYPMDTGSRNIRDNRDDIIYYRKPDFYQRPVDEIDTPPFPNELNGKRPEPIFAKILNPGVKIMRVDRDVDDNNEGYRYSDSSQYDNVPTRMRNITHSILKRQRDVSFNVPPPPKSYGISERTKDEMEMLEECFGVLRMTSTATQTRPPSSATEPGFVRHTASNWPRDNNTKTPGSSPDRDKRF